MPLAAKYTSNSASTFSSVSAAKAKANLSAILKGVENKRAPVTTLGRGVPIAQIISVPDQPTPLLRGSMVGTARILGDSVSPLGIECMVGNE